MDLMYPTAISSVSCGYTHFYRQGIQWRLLQCIQPTDRNDVCFDEKHESEPKLIVESELIAAVVPANSMVAEVAGGLEHAVGSFVLILTSKRRNIWRFMETKCVSRAYTVANEDNTECILEPTRNNRLLYPVLKNSKGYELEKEFNSGITHISPVWYDLKRGLGGGAILGRDYLSLLEKHKPKLQWEKIRGERFFLYSEENNNKIVQLVRLVVFYPSLLSIAMRLDEARAWGAGLSIWEIGQGLDYFFDLL